MKKILSFIVFTTLSTAYAGFDCKGTDGKTSLQLVLNTDNSAVVVLKSSGKMTSLNGHYTTQGDSFYSTYQADLTDPKGNSMALKVVKSKGGGIDTPICNRRYRSECPPASLPSGASIKAKLSYLGQSLNLECK